ncbi:oxygen-independent coproporphyrinogen III oxidase [Mucilaginibacter sp. PPCGB 2223]|uniref:oxygen-independent coproporphyrinogen III oxidase n=1 Tax=Mucilaginibacter sp. PPCGB 2223 TaxID=1886027 RepID=UPI0008265E73|nr:oxygen-independent coproporphyrinogen III oxidase [Mucilaginibacter sp. PPCGB 2223]OCX54823.1 oxygen-independent coproporphyrinogen III oxidase [Mucilaginibacter sp. PPCGB 2223]
MLPHQLAGKYNVAAPRYTSYPTMPYWHVDSFDISQWKQSVRLSFDETNTTEGISLYLHLPFCENLCTYCGCNTRITKNHGVEVPYINALLKEWQMYLDVFEAVPIIREIHLGGGTPTFFSPDNLRMLINGILQKAKVHPSAAFSFEGHPANTTTEHLQTLYDLGFRRVSIGIQDFDPQVRFIINRDQSFEQVRDVTIAARQIGYTSINYDLIYGLPLQTTEGLINTVQLVAQLRPDRIAFYSYAHVPWIKPGQRRFTEQDLPDAPQKAKLYEVGRSMFATYGYEEIGMDHFALPQDELSIAQKNGTLHRNFMGYTTQQTQLLIGLGVSAISDSGYAFAQNVKMVEAYHAYIDDNQLPAFKGHVLTKEDSVIRNHIFNIMCKGETKWNLFAEPCMALVQAVERLEPLATDGLVELHSSGLKVTPLGKRFLRNICMAFDARLWNDKPATQQFSMAI